MDSGGDVEGDGEALLLVVDYERVCRVCLQSRGALLDLFVNDAEPSLTQQLSLLCDIQVYETDNLPRLICHKCRYILESCYELRSIALKSEKLLRDSVEADQLLGRVAGALPEDQLSSLLKDGPESTSTMDGTDLDVVEDSFAGGDTEIELCAEDSPDCKIELIHAYGLKMETENKNYVSSKDVTLDEITFEDTDASQIQLLPEMSDDGGSDGITIKLKDSNGLDRPSKQQTCQICLEVFADRSTLFAHITEHYKNSDLIPYVSATKPYNCQECNLTFQMKTDLIVHHREHLGINPFMCKVAGCNFDIKTKEALRHHMYTHVLKKYGCNLCGARYRRKIEILRHRMRHMDEGRQFRCGLCWVVCKNRLSLKAHLKNHEMGKRFKCDFPGCPKGFYSKSDLIIHSRSHSNDKCYKCPRCVCAYTSQSQLNRHLRRHKKAGPTKCDKCSEIFDDYGSFCNHRIATHGEWQPHRCKGCNQGYQSEQQLEKHLSRCDIALKMKALDTSDIDMIIEEKDYSNDHITR